MLFDFLYVNSIAFAASCRAIRFSGEMIINHLGKVGNSADEDQDDKNLLHDSNLRIIHQSGYHRELIICKISP